MASGRGWHPAGGRSPVLAVAPVLACVPTGCGAVGTTASVAGVRCPSCASLDDKVTDSRATEDGTAIRRRRECLSCGRRFTTFERLEDVPLLVTKRSGDRVPFDRDKIESGVRAAAKGRPVTDAQLASLAAEIEEHARLAGTDIQSEEIGVAVLERLRDIDKVAYVRFASVYKDFADPSDFQRELRLLTKATAPKRH
jgi:transcriptional repressor NrdR